jgi:hypothetical protein
MNNVYEGLNAYKTYLAIKNHFNTNYDYFKYNGKLKVSNDSFLKRRDKFFFAKLERNYKEHELIYFFVANFIDNDNSWSGSLVGSESEKKYLQWRKRIESLKYTFKMECEKIQNEMELKELSFDGFFKARDNDHPYLLRLYLGNHISLETFIIIDGLLNFTKQWNNCLKDDIIYCTVRDKSNKYKSFLQVDLQAYKKIMKSVFTS